MTLATEDLRDFIQASIGSLVAEVTRLSGMMNEQSRLIRDIQITTTTRVAELQKDIEELREDVHELKTDQKSITDSQRFNWKQLNEQRAAERKEQAKKDEDQAVINNAMKTVNKLLWLILGVLLSLGIPFVWSMIVNGGVKGLIVVP